jgi:DNA-binding IclR family transcriptional regulator
MTDDEIRAALPHIAPMLKKYPRITRRYVEDQIACSRARGYVVMLDAVVEQMGGIAVPVLGPDGRPMGALSVAALSERIAAREAVLAAGLRAEVATIAACWDVKPALRHARAPGQMAAQ